LLLLAGLDVLVFRHVSVFNPCKDAHLLGFGVRASRIFVVQKKYANAPVTQRNKCRRKEPNIHVDLLSRIELD
jgi:hypothetical protein